MLFNCFTWSSIQGVVGVLEDCRRLRENLESFMESRERERGGLVLPSGEGR